MESDAELFDEPASIYLETICRVSEGFVFFSRGRLLGTVNLLYFFRFLLAKSTNPNPKKSCSREEVEVLETTTFWNILGPFVLFS